MKLNVPPLVKELALGHRDGLPVDALHDALCEAGMDLLASYYIGPLYRSGAGGYTVTLGWILNSKITDRWHDSCHPSWLPILKELERWEAK